MIKNDLIKGIRKFGIIAAATMCVGMTACGSTDDSKAADAKNTVSQESTTKSSKETTSQTTTVATTAAETKQKMEETTQTQTTPETQALDLNIYIWNNYLD